MRLIISQNDISKFLRLWMKDYPDRTRKIRNVPLWELRSPLWSIKLTRCALSGLPTSVQIWSQRAEGSFALRNRKQPARAERCERVTNVHRLLIICLSFEPRVQIAIRKKCPRKPTDIFIFFLNLFIMFSDINLYD